MSRGQLRWRLRTQWQQVLPGVLATFSRRLDDDQRLVAAALLVGPEGVITSLTAARWYGLEVPDSTRVLIDVPITRHARSYGHVEVRRTRLPDHNARSHGVLRIASPPRALADAVRDCHGQREATALALQAVQRGLVTPQQLRAEHDLHRRAGNAFLLRAIEAAVTNSWSAPEHDLYQALTADKDLPEVWANPLLTAPSGQRLPTPDLWIDDVALAIQVHSRKHHESTRDWETTVEKDSIFAVHGVPVLAFTPSQIARGVVSVVHRVEQTYLTLRERPRPSVQAMPRAGMFA